MILLGRGLSLLLSRQQGIIFLRVGKQAAGLLEEFVMAQGIAHLSGLVIVGSDNLAGYQLLYDILHFVQILANIMA